MNSIIDSENKIKEQLKYIETEKEREAKYRVDRDPQRRGVVNEQLWWRQQHR